MPGDYDLHQASGRERMMRDLGKALRQIRPDLMADEGLYRSPPGFASWASHWAKAVAVELALEESEQQRDHVGIWAAMVCRWARQNGAEPRYLSPSLAEAFLRTERPPFSPALPQEVGPFRLFLPRGTLYSEEGPEIRTVVVADVRRMQGWLPDHFVLNGGGLACIGIGEDGATYLASCLFDPVAQAQQPEHTDFSSSHWQWDAAGVRGTAARMEQLAVHAFLVQLYAQALVAEGEIPPDPTARGFGGGNSKEKGKAKGKGTDAVVLPPVWLGRDYRVQGQPAEGLVQATDAIRTDPRRGGDNQPAPSGPHWRRGYWRALSPLKGPVAAPLEWVEPEIVL